MIKNRRILVLVVVVIAVVVIAAILVLTRPSENTFPYKGPGECLDRIINDANGNGKLDPGETDLNVPGLQIQITDPNGPSSGLYSFVDCHFVGTDKGRTLHLHVIVPQGYTATSPVDIDVSVQGGTGFDDYLPPLVNLLLQLNGTATPAQ